MKYINEPGIREVLRNNMNPCAAEVDKVLEKASGLKGLTMDEAAMLLSLEKAEDIRRLQDAASYVKKSIYGSRVVLFAPLYLSNVCSNDCLYCAFRTGNRSIVRKKLTQPEIAAETMALLKQGHKRILVVASEQDTSDRAYFVEAIKTIYAQRHGSSAIRRVNINCAPLSVEDFRQLKAAGIGTYQLFQETYHEETYRKVHLKGPKSDPDNRMDAIDRAFEAGIDDVGIGVLYGLYDHRFETMALLAHIRHLEEKFNVGPHTISVPRLEPAAESGLSINSPFMVSDGDFRKVVAVLRLAVPYTGIILSTRETPEMRNELFTLGVSQISAASNTSPGGYSAEPGEDNTQFSLNDHRSLDETVGSLISKGAIPSFCAACYRKERTGGRFMKMAKPGTIKGKCRLNALITLKEYLDDFASEEVKAAGYDMISRVIEELDPEEKTYISGGFERIASGTRDEYV